MEFQIKDLRPSSLTSFLFVTIIILIGFVISLYKLQHKLISSSCFRAWWVVRLSLFPAGVLPFSFIWVLYLLKGMLKIFFIALLISCTWGNCKSKICLFYYQSFTAFISSLGCIHLGFTQSNAKSLGTWDLFSKLNMSWLTDIYLKWSIGLVSNILEETGVIVSRNYAFTFPGMPLKALGISNICHQKLFCLQFLWLHSACSQQRKFFFLRWWLSFYNRYPLFSPPAERKLAQILKSQSIP